MADVSERTDEDRLGALVAAWIELRQGRLDRITELLREDVVWRGVLPDQVCRNREEVLHLFARRGAPALTRFEAEEFGDRVVLSVEGPEFPAVEGQPDDHRRSFVFTFAGNHVSRIDSMPTRERAYQIAQPR